MSWPDGWTLTFIIYLYNLLSEDLFKNCPFLFLYQKSNKMLLSLYSSCTCQTDGHVLMLSAGTTPHHAQCRHRYSSLPGARGPISLLPQLHGIDKFCHLKNSFLPYKSWFSRSLFLALLSLRVLVGHFLYLNIWWIFCIRYNNKIKESHTYPFYT